MLVKDLIKKLQKVDQNLRVAQFNGEFDSEVDEIRIEDAIYDKETQEFTVLPEGPVKGSIKVVYI